MGLDSAIYFLFLGCIAVFHAWLPARGRIVLLLLASLGFYAMSSVGYLLLFLVLCGLNYLAVRRLSDGAVEKGRGRVAVLAVALNLGVLVSFKYAIGIIDAAVARLGLAGHPDSGWARLAIPLGVSYFSFQMIACAIDSYSRRWKIDGGIARFALFGLFFPQVTAGPIPRAGRLWPQLDGRTPTAEDRLLGLRLIAFGLFKKFAVANRLGDVVTQFFNNPGSMTALPAMVGCCLNAVQLYADFSGYTDIAIGSARLLGIGLDKNFDRPYLSASVTELWQRWHITLSFWVRDYIFTPLAWNIRHCGKLAAVIALMVSFVVIGLWHAAAWTFLFFGLAQGLVVSLELLTRSWREQQFAQVPRRWRRMTGQFYAMGFFVLSLVLFKAANLAQAQRIYLALLNWRLPYSKTELLLHSGPSVFALICLVIILWERLAAGLAKSDERATQLFVVACAAVTLLLGQLSAARFVYATF